mmetsp:Transcript_16848/g.25746  ORF Transcript_16848/g.25746 Transcript_16848/m.25746 type:complete len:98 (-) Transcript_16848:235-528(-)
MENTVLNSSFVGKNKVEVDNDQKRVGFRSAQTALVAIKTLASETHQPTTSVFGKNSKRKSSLASEFQKRGNMNLQVASSTRNLDYGANHKGGSWGKH